jgi:hypothetical protein
VTNFLHLLNSKYLGTTVEIEICVKWFREKKITAMTRLKIKINLEKHIIRMKTMVKLFWLLFCNEQVKFDICRSDCSYTVIHESFFSRNIALYICKVLWRKVKMTPLYLCSFFFLSTPPYLRFLFNFPKFFHKKRKQEKI